MASHEEDQPRQTVIAVWLVVAFAAYAVGGFHALAYSIGHGGTAPTFDEIVLRVDWLRLVLLALAISAPAGLLTAAEARLARLPGMDTTLATLVVAVAAILALWLAYQSGPDLVGLQA